MSATSLPAVLMVRPRRARLKSMFTDYWTQVGIAMGDLEGDQTIHPDHRQRLLEKYAAGAVHYRNADGSIDGVAWFTAFARYGAGVAYSFDEVFAGDVARMQRELDTGALRPVETKNLDAFIEDLTGVPAAPRRRESNVVGDPAVEAALDDAADLIEDLARRDAPFDRAIAEHLGVVDFFVE